MSNEQKLGPTPGSWYLANRGAIVAEGATVAEDTVLFEIPGSPAPMTPQQIADAKLVVAAKDLLEAAKLMKAFYDDLANSNPGFMSKLVLQDYAQWNNAMLKLPAAIAKAEGR